jgi:hypothetical protein
MRARRILNTHLDARMEDPEARKFEPGFLDRVLEARPALLSDALIIWRWGRQTVVARGKPLGSYETWGMWCRDPLLALGCRDPVDRITEIKAADPRRRALMDFFEVWNAVHRDSIVKGTDVAPEVIKYIDEKAGRKPDGNLDYSRHRVTKFLRDNRNTHPSDFQQGYRPIPRSLSAFRLPLHELDPLSLVRTSSERLS